jgi:hypothetical protein
MIHQRSPIFDEENPGHCIALCLNRKHWIHTTRPPLMISSLHPLAFLSTWQTRGAFYLRDRLSSSRIPFLDLGRSCIVIDNPSLDLILYAYMRYIDRI